MPRPPAPHGTYSAYKRHLREKSKVCAACANSRDERTAEQREQRRRAASATAPEVAEVATAEPAAAPDRRSELEWNLALVKQAMASVAGSDASKLAPLSKRHSELLAELATITDASAAKEDPFDAFFGSPLDPNVVGIGSAPSRKQA